MIINESQPLLAGKIMNNGCFQFRYVFLVLGFFGLVNVYIMRVNLSIALIAMVNRTENHESVKSECKPFSNGTHDTIKTGTFDWDEKTQGLILGSYFLGHIITNLPGGRLAETVNGKWVFGLGIFCMSIFTLLTPFAARNGFGYLIAVRIIEGLGGGVTYPSMHSMISKWAPRNERSRFVAIICSGGLLGTVIGLIASGYLCLYGFDGGWPSAFYVSGIIGIVWFILWAIFASDNPNSHPWVSEEEKLYIQRDRPLGEKNRSSPALPWKKISTSLAVWAITISHFGNNWGFYIYLNELPTFLNTILHFGMAKDSVLSTLPYVCHLIFGTIAGFLCDKIIEKNLLITRNARKLFNSIALFIPAILLLALTRIRCDDEKLSFSLLVIAMGINGCSHVGFGVNHIDIAPNFAGTLLGLTNTFATIPGWAGPYLVGSLTQGNETIHQWSIVFYITAAIYIFSGLFYLIFGKAEEQSWNKGDIQNILIE